jgi:hypothetical protein
MAFAAAGRLSGQTSAGEWGSPVVEYHHHPQRTLEANMAHLDGAGLTNAMLYKLKSS